MYTLVRQQKDKIPWTKLVWFSQGVLRFDFITWLVFQDRLATGHRTCRWGQTVLFILWWNPMRRETISFVLRVRIRSLSGCRLWGLCLVLNLTQTGRSPLRRCSQDLMIDSRSSCFVGFYNLLSISFGGREMQGSTTKGAKPVDQLARMIDKTVITSIMSTKYYMKPKL